MIETKLQGFIKDLAVVKGGGGGGGDGEGGGLCHEGGNWGMSYIVQVHMRWEYWNTPYLRKVSSPSRNSTEYPHTLPPPLTKCYRGYVFKGLSYHL